MSGTKSYEPMLDMYIFETTQLVEQLEQLVLDGEKTGGVLGSINDIFRIMHTIKGSSAMMLFNHIADLTHSVEDLFYFLRENRPDMVDTEALSDIILDTVDFIKGELSKIEQQVSADGDATERIQVIRSFLVSLKEANQLNPELPDEKPQTVKTERFFVTNKVKQTDSERRDYKAIIYFEDGCEMENIRAFGVVHRLSEIAENISHIPEQVIEDNSAIEQIKNEGFLLFFSSTLGNDAVKSVLEDTIFLKTLQLEEVSPEALSQSEGITFKDAQQITLKELKKPEAAPDEKSTVKSPQNQSFISVNLDKTERLMDLIGELVIAEAMVTQNPDLTNLVLDNFQKAARHLKKITSEIQDVVMSIRMVPLEATFQKMQRIVRDMSKKMDKDINLQIIGEETEVDKNIIEHISDPLMHLVRNAIDHGLELKEERLSLGKDPAGTLTLEAKNSGSDVLILVKDDGKGLDKEKILKKAKQNGLLNKAEYEMTDKEIYNLIFLPGFSTKENVTEFSGRGVGLDVVTKNLEAIGGSTLIDSTPGVGTTIMLKIPLTLAIIDGMNIRVGTSRYTLPTVSIKESFRPRENDIFKDPDGNEMIMVRGHCYPIIRLHEFYRVETRVQNLSEGILIMVEHNEDSFCIFADELLGQQQVVVKALPEYVHKLRNIKGLSGCTLLGDGSISLILDISGIKELYYTNHYGRRAAS